MILSIRMTSQITMSFPCSFDPMDSDTWVNLEHDDVEIPDNVEDLNAHPLPSTQEPVEYEYEYEEEEESPVENHVQTAENDCDIHFSDSIENSIRFFEDHLGIPIYRLSKQRIFGQGLIVLPLQYFCRIRRQTGKKEKPTPNIIVIPSHIGFWQNHDDFASCMHIFYPEGQEST